MPQLSRSFAIAACLAMTFCGLTTTTLEVRAERAVLIDRIVATVEDKPIYRSDVLLRTRPIVARLEAKDRKDPQKLKQIQRELLERMIDETLIANDAAKARIDATDDEIERAVLQITKENKLTRSELGAELKKQGMTIDEYKQEIRRQIIELKWVQLRVRSRVLEPEGTTSEDERKQKVTALVELERKKLIGQMRAQSHVEIHW